MNSAGTFDATISPDGQSGASHSYFHVESVSGSGHPPADAIVVPDAHFLFHADFKRSGLDLVLHQDDHELVLHDYFKGDKRAALASPDGAHLTGDIVNALAGSVDVAQAGGPPAAGQVIGHVTKLVGSATAIRNGVSIILNMGDNVEKGDVVQSGSDSTLGISFIDGTVFGLSSNARMVLNEMVYDPNGSNNSSLLSLVAGTITFVAGETAKHGDMKVDTPVATMGIRGTAVLVEIDFTIPGQGDTPDAKFQVLVEPDGTTGSYILFDKTTLQPLAVVNQAGQQINISNGVISQSSAPLSPDVQKLITDVFSLKFSANDTNPKTTTAQNDTTNPLLTGPIKLASGATATPIFETLITGSSPTIQTLDTPTIFLFRVPGPPTATVLDSHGNLTTSFTLTELAGRTGDTDSDTVGGTVNFVDFNPGDRPTVSVSLAHLTLYNSQHQQIAGLDATNLPTGGSLQINDLIAAGIKITVVPASGNNNNGSATWSYSLVDKAFDFLGAGESITLTYNVRVDNNYTPADQATTIPITITITGTNDAPVITTGPQTLAFSGGKNVDGGTLNDLTTGKLNFTDVDLDDTHKVAAKFTSAVMSDGSEVPKGPLDLLEKATAFTASIETDSTGTGTGVIDWQLAALPVYIADFIPKGKTLTVTYTVTVTDSQGATSEQTVTVKITGTDDKAVVWIHTDGDGSPDNHWSTAQNWETGTVPTASDDVIIITNQLIGLTPSYPVTIDKNTAAVAHSLKMDDYSDVKPRLYNFGSLTIGGQLMLLADSVLKNFKNVSVGGEADFDGTSRLVNRGTFTIGGLAKFDDKSSLQNSGMLILQQGGEFADSSAITNHERGTIEVAGGTLTVSVDVSNLGQIAVDEGATLTLNSGTIDGGEAGGALCISGTLNLDGTSFLKNGILANTGQVDVGGTVVFDNEAVTNTHSGAIDIAGALTLQGASSITNGKANAETVESKASLTLLDTSYISGGVVTNRGTLNLEGSSALESGHLHNTGGVNVSGSGVVFDGERVTNSGNGAIDIAGALTLLDATRIKNGESNAETVEREASLTLLDKSYIRGGLVTNYGTLNFEGRSALKSGQLDNAGNVNVSGSGVVFHGETVTNTGAGGIDISGTLTLLDASSIANGESNAETVEREASLTLLDKSHISGGLVANYGTLNLDGRSALKGGQLDNTGSLNVSGRGVVFNGEIVSNTGDGAIDITGALTLQDASSIANGEGNKETVESKGSLTLSDTSSIVGGALSNAGNVYIEASTGATFDGVKVDNFSGTIHIDAAEKSATLILDDGTSITGGHLDIGGAGELVVSTVDGATLSGVTVENWGLVQVDEGSILALNGSKIENGTVVNDGIIDSTGASAIDAHSLINDGVIKALSGTLTIDPGTLTNSATLDADGGELDISGETVGNTGTIGAVDGGTLKLISSTIDNTGDGTVTVGGGSTLDLDHSGIWGGTLIISGTLDNIAGSNIITAAITEDGGSIDVIGGSLDLAGSVAGDVKIAGSSTVELGAAGTSAYAATAVIFETGATGTLVLDHAESFAGTIQGLDDNTIDLADISYASNATVRYSGDITGGTLSIFVDGVDVSNIKLVGDYLGVHWALGDDGTSQHGTTLTEVPGVIAGLDANGNADQGDALTVSITDGGAAVTGASYDWQVSTDGVHWTKANGTNGLSSYTPVEADEGESLRVSLSFTDSNGNAETSSVSAGVVQEGANDLVATLSCYTAQQGVPIKVTEVTDGGVRVTTGVTYAWQVSSDGGKSWSTISTKSSFTPGEAQEGKLLQLVVTYKDAAGSESATYDLGMPDDLAVVLDDTSAHQGVPIHVTKVTDGGDVVWSGLTYAWQTSSDGQNWTTVGVKSSYTPGPGDDGKLLQLVVTYVDPGEHESVISSLGVVTADSHWTGGSHTWESATHWTPSGVPASDNDAIVDARGDFYTVTIDQASVAHSLLLNSAAAKLEIVRGGSLTLGGDATFTQGTFQVDSGGTLKDIAVSATISGSFTANGTVEAGGGKLEIAGVVAGAGSFKIDPGATLQLDHASSHNVTFSGSGELILEDPAHYSGTVSDVSGSMTAKDVLDLAGFDTGASVQYIGDTSGGTLKISEAHHTTVSIKVGANSTNWSTPVSDGDGGILIHDPPVTDSLPTANADAAPKPNIATNINGDGLWSSMGGDSFVFKNSLGRNFALDSGHSADPAQSNHQGAAGMLPLLVAAADDAQADLFPPGSVHTNIPDSMKALLLAHHNDFHLA